MLEYVLQKLEREKGRLPLVAREAGISYKTLQKIASKDTHSPRIHQVQKLYDYFRAQAAESA